MLPRAVSGNQSVIAPLASILEEGSTAGNTSLFNVKCNWNQSPWIAALGKKKKKTDVRFLNPTLPQAVKWKPWVQHLGVRKIGFSLVSQLFFTER